MKYLLFILTVFILFAGCKKEPSSPSTKCNSCSHIYDCTLIFMGYSVQIKNSDSTSYRLDKYVTIRAEDNKLIDIQSTKSPREDSITKSRGVYNILTDDEMNLTDTCGKEFYFIGYRNDVEVLKEKYIFNHDCCHIQLVSGARVIIK